MELFEKSGIMSIGSRLRWLTETLTRDAAEIYRLYGIDMKPKWFPVLYMLSGDAGCPVTAIAKAIGQSHPSVSNIIKELKGAGLVEERHDATDRRMTAVTLTPAGIRLRNALEKVCRAVERAVKDIEAESGHKLWSALDNWETQLAEKSLLHRVADLKKRHEGRGIEIVPYTPEHLAAFKRLNIMWINSHWSLEPHDLEVLGNPQASILDKGGYIFVALVDNEPMGVVAMCRMENPAYDFELAKLAVDPRARGTGIGEKICRAAIDHVRSLGAKRIFLESNTLLRPAISLYRKLGFNELEEYHPAYQRGDIQMELTI